MLTPFVRLAVVVLGVLPAPARQDAVTFDWTAYGHALRTHMPKCVADASALKQIHYLAEQTADKLAFLGIPPNYDEAGRDRALRKFNDSWLGTCGHTAQCLRQVCGGAGFSSKACKTLVALKRGLDGQVPLEINADHAALVYLHPEGPVVFDLWCDGRTQNTFAGFRASVWKGMPAGEWARRMTLEGYTVAGVQEHPELGETPPLRLMELLAKLPK